MQHEIHRDSPTAWRSLRTIGGLEPDDRDQDLVLQLKNQVDPRAPSLDAALADLPVEHFLQALFQVIQPFALMFRDVLEFFQRAGAREGQAQWKIAVGDHFADLRHFEEFVEQWNSIACELEVPAIDSPSAFLHNTVRRELGGSDYLFEDNAPRGKEYTGIEDVDSWLRNYDNGRYAPLPQSLNPDTLLPGLDDAARIVIAALAVLDQLHLDRKKVLEMRRSESYEPIKHDAFHPWAIAQNEIDKWLREMVLALGRLLGRPKQKQSAFGERLASEYKRFSRRRVGARVQVKDLERLLSLPVWKRRYEFYGVWVATETVGALHGHRIHIRHSNGELRFAFAEARIADVTTARPKVSLIAERRTELSHPVGKNRKQQVQPDFGIWTDGEPVNWCTLVVEIKHYKKRSRQNFREALIDYARAHPSANVLLVNYGQVGLSFTDLPEDVRSRCQMIGDLTPLNRMARSEFHERVRDRVGDPVTEFSQARHLKSGKTVVIDISASMHDILESNWFEALAGDLARQPCEVVLVDRKINAVIDSERLEAWLSKRPIGLDTSLGGPIQQLLESGRKLLVVTDSDGIKTLHGCRAKIVEHPVEVFHEVRILEISEETEQ